MMQTILLHVLIALCTFMHPEECKSLNSDQGESWCLSGRDSSIMLPIFYKSRYYNRQGVIKLEFTLPYKAHVSVKIVSPDSARCWSYDSGELLAGNQTLFFKVSRLQGWPWYLTLTAEREGRKASVSLTIE